MRSLRELRTATVTRAWPTVVALIVLWSMALADQLWVFAVLFLVWGVIDALVGETYLIQRLTRRQQPLAYWAVVITWIAMSALWLLYPV